MTDEPDDLDPALEWKLRAAALPIAFALALLFEASPTGHMVQRTFLTMIPHELGHALTGWWCGYVCLPGLWKTTVPETRSLVAVAGVLGACGGLGYLAWRAERRALVGVAAVGGALAALGMTRGDAAAHTAITFGGDGGALVLGTLLVLAFFAPAGSKLRAGGVRWGLLAIGAATYVDVAMTWVHAKGDHDRIPFGEIEGVGLSDPSRLAEAGWSPGAIVGRYLTLAALCGCAIVAVWAWQTWAMRRRGTGG